MLGKRQNEILKIIVEEYIKSAKPVGSKSICDVLKCSSATVRNEMAYLRYWLFSKNSYFKWKNT